ncbi:FAD-dependent oxidoreductase [Streptococcus suis]|uniref:FAD-dependent oxidoreductase n=1 Tax=Streptococcus suis TaxID=1307 RepID=UPI00040469FF|nr:FAD-dependent oxidoreductase [Streptococcus suis]HEM3194481.1 FAD-dependent oxidoreductase [Streptococcus suis 10581]HEL2592247.1 FAD-dependent oxidoreductase [Streptococcus suis]HEM5030915.1 FAD-dependent oxidoreductase [Streptococcus suis]HEM5047250.1 FAD-dependent oxidoreductase [Streptococcus suis]
MKIIIVGGVAGGMSAATRLRRLMEDAEIIVFEKGPYVSFANCGLPYYISGEIAEHDSLLLQTPESLKQRFNLDVRPFHEVISIDAEQQTVTVKTPTGELIEGYDKLILSPGAKPVIPNLSGIEEANNLFTLRNVPDLDKIMAKLDQIESGQAIVIGAGFIGLEMAENIALKGWKVTLVEQAPHVLPTFDLEMARYVEAELTNKGVEVITRQSVTAFHEKGQVLELSNGQHLASDVTILSVGVAPDSQLAKNAGVELGLRGGILVDQNYQTSQKNIYAVGDAIVVKQEITGQDALISLASPANRQGRQVADVIAGLDRKNKGSIGTAIVKVFDLAAASTGLSERAVQSLGYEHAVVHTTGKDHASYYPGATDIVLKLIFSPTDGKIFGAQAVGQKGVDKRIDVLATAIKAGLTIFDLPELELTYAPPFGSAKDPVNMIGYAAMNIAEGISQNIQWHQLDDELATGKVILDVRNPGEVANGQFREFLHIPLDQLRERIGELDASKEYIVSCHSGLRSYIAERILKEKGFGVKNLDGAFSLYKIALPENIIQP